VLRQAMQREMSELRSEASRIIHIRKRDLTEQKMELKGLLGKNATVIRHMRARIAQEQSEFDLGGARIHAVRSVHLRLLKDVFSLLGATALKAEMSRLTTALGQKGLKLGVKRAYKETFESLRNNLHKVQALNSDIQVMLQATFSQLNAEYGFSLQAMAVPNLDDYYRQLAETESTHVHYLGFANVFKLSQPEFADRVVQALSTRIRAIHEDVLAEVELCSKSAASQLDMQLRERRRNFTRRIEAVDRIAHAAEALDERIHEISEQDKALNQMEQKLLELTSYLTAARSAQAASPVDVEIP